MSKWRRFERYASNDLWQIDGTQVILADESLGWIVDILDAHARFAIGATATPPVHRYRRLAGNGVSDH